MVKKEKRKKMNPLLWFLFAIIIPVSIVLVLVLIILNIAGYDTFNWLKEKGNNVPIVSDMITTDDELEKETTEQRYQEMIEEKDQEIEALTQEVSDQETIIQDLEREIIKLENSQDPIEQEVENQEQASDKLKRIVKSYQEMDPERAALIIQNMKDRSTSVSILEGMANDARGEILQEMDPEIAADITEKLMTNSNNQ